MQKGIEPDLSSAGIQNLIICQKAITRKIYSIHFEINEAKN